MNNRAGREHVDLDGRKRGGPGDKVVPVLGKRETSPRRSEKEWRWAQPGEKKKPKLGANLLG